MKPGITCESIDKINERIDKGELSHENKQGNQYDPTILSKNYADASAEDGEPLRYSETVMRVWFAPFEDNDGNYHQASEIFTITKPGSWIGQPPHELKTSS